MLKSGLQWPTSIQLVVFSKIMMEDVEKNVYMEEYLSTYQPSTHKYLSLIKVHMSSPATRQPSKDTYLPILAAKFSSKEV